MLGSVDADDTAGRQGSVWLLCMQVCVCMRDGGGIVTGRTECYGGVLGGTWVGVALLVFLAGFI